MTACRCKGLKSHYNYETRKLNLKNLEQLKDLR